MKRRFFHFLQTTICILVAQTAFAVPAVGTLETIAELPIRPGNVSATVGGQIFATIHPLDEPSGLQLIEITGRNTFRPWPSANFQSNEKNRGRERIDSPLGITQDGQGRLWISDMGLNLGVTRIWGFDINSGRLEKQIELPSSIAPKGSFIQDLIVDAEMGWIYLADINNPALLAVRIEDGYARRFQGHWSLQAEDGAELRIAGKQTYFSGKPAKIGVNPVTISADGKILFYGAMTGTHWYSLSTQSLREGSDAEVAATIRLIGNKPVSDGAATDSSGNHFFTNLNEDAIGWLDQGGQYRTLVRSPLLNWPDSIQFGEQSWLYISVNQLHMTKAFTGSRDEGRPPYRILRVWTGTTGAIRR